MMLLLLLLYWFILLNCRYCQLFNSCSLLVEEKVSQPSLVCINLAAHEQNIISLWNLNSLQNNLRKFPPIKIYLFLFYHQQRKHISTEAAGNLDRRLFFDRKNVLTENYISLEPFQSLGLRAILFIEDNKSGWPQLHLLAGALRPPGSHWYCQSG